MQRRLLKLLYYSTSELVGGAGPPGARATLPPIPDLQGKDVRANWNAVTLAFLGDTVWEVTAYPSAYMQ